MDNRPETPPARYGRPRVYVTMGSGGMFSDDTVQAVLDACADRPWDAFGSLGIGDRPELRVPANVTVGGLTGLTRPLRWADVVLTRGGSTTILAALADGKPMVVVPVMSECEMNGRQYVERTGAGLVARFSEDASGRVSFRSRYADRAGPSAHSAGDSRRAVDDVLSDGTFARRARELGARLREAGSRRSTLPEAVAHLF